MLHLSHQNYILSKAFKKVVTWEEGGSKMDLVGSPVVKPLSIKSLNACLSKVVMCTEANDLLKFRIDYFYQIRIIFLVKLLKKL